MRKRVVFDEADVAVKWTDLTSLECAVIFRDGRVVGPVGAEWRYPWSGGFRHNEALFRFDNTAENWSPPVALRVTWEGGNPVRVPFSIENPDTPRTYLQVTLPVDA